MNSNFSPISSRQIDLLVKMNPYFFSTRKSKNYEHKCVQMKVSSLESNWYTYSVSHWPGVVSHLTQQPVCICKNKWTRVHQNTINISLAM